MMNYRSCVKYIFYNQAFFIFNCLMAVAHSINFLNAVFLRPGKCRHPNIILKQLFSKKSVFNYYRYALSVLTIRSLKNFDF